MLSSARIRPGISNEFLAHQGIVHVEKDEGHALLGYRVSGLAIPYQHFATSQPVVVNGRAYYRIRVDPDSIAGSNGARYLAPTNSGSQLYVPSQPPFSSSELVVCEGEFKALALCEAGVRAVAIGGITCALAGGKLLPALERLLKRYAIKTIYFLGDADTALNFDFAREAVKLARAVNAHVLLPRISWNLPKGIDDCREFYHFGDPPGDFLQFWHAIKTKAIEVDTKREASSLALELAGSALAHLGEDEKQRVVELAVYLDVLDQDTLARAMHDKFGTSLTRFRQAIAEYIRDRNEQREIQIDVAKLVEKAKSLGTEIYVYKTRYIVRVARGGKFCEMNETQLSRKLAAQGFDEVEISVLLEHATKQEQQIDMHVALAGRRAGVETNNGNSILVTGDPPSAKAATQPGPFDVIQTLLDNMLGSEQLGYFFTWLQCARRRILRQQWVPLQSVIFAGDPNAGKTFVAQEIVARSLGRCASAFDYMSDKTAFNEDLASAELLLMDDECSSSLDRKAQNAISDFLKVVAVRESHRVAPKGQKAMQLALTTTCLICVNLEAKNLKIIPQGYENDMRNRVHVFKCDVQPMPMPTTTETDKFAFRDRVRQELPSFLHFVDREWNVPTQKVKLDPYNRFPCKAFQNRDVIEKVAENSELAEFRAKVRDHLSNTLKGIPHDGWFSAARLQRDCCSRMSVCAVGRLLTVWHKECPDEVIEQRHTRLSNQWRIVL